MGGGVGGFPAGGRRQHLTGRQVGEAWERGEGQGGELPKQQLEVPGRWGRHGRGSGIQREPSVW